MTNIGPQLLVSGIAGIDIDGSGINSIEETLLESRGGNGGNTDLRAV